MFIRPCLRHQSRATCPLASHPDAEQDAEYRQLNDIVGEAASSREDRVDQHTPDQRPCPAEAICNHTEDQPTGSSSHQRDRAENTRSLLRQSKIENERRQDQRVEHDVKGIQHPAERSRGQRTARIRSGFTPPIEPSSPRFRTQCLYHFRPRPELTLPERDPGAASQSLRPQGTRCGAYPRPSAQAEPSL